MRHRRPGWSVKNQPWTREVHDRLHNGLLCNPPLPPEGWRGFSTTLMRRRRSGAGPDLAPEGCSVVSLGDAADLVGDAGPAVAAILAHMHGALGVTDEELIAAGPARHGQRLDMGAGRHGEALRLGVPAAPVI